MKEFTKIIRENLRRPHLGPQTAVELLRLRVCEDEFLLSHADWKIMGTKNTSQVRRSDHGNEGQSVNKVEDFMHSCGREVGE